MLKQFTFSRSKDALRVGFGALLVLTVIVALAGITTAYLIMFAIVFDYSRWVSNWAVCVFLMLHAVRMLPASRETAPIPVDDTKTTIFAVIVTLIPRVGIVRPF